MYMYLFVYFVWTRWSKSTFSNFIAELREETLSDLVHLAIATEGVSLASKDLFASAIAAHALGTGPRVKYSANSGRVARAALPAAKNPALLSTFNSLYTDTGLFGFHVIANKSDVAKVNFLFMHE